MLKRNEPLYSLLVLAPEISTLVRVQLQNTSQISELFMPRTILKYKLELIPEGPNTLRKQFCF